jgi:hypothetical protein
MAPSRAGTRREGNESLGGFCYVNWLGTGNGRKRTASTFTNVGASGSEDGGRYLRDECGRIVDGVVGGGACREVTGWLL